MESGNEETLLHSVALKNAQSILLARQRAEEDIVRANAALERKTLELAQSLAMMRATLESTTDAILVTDGAGFVTDFNQKYREMWRLPADVMESKSHRRLLEATSNQFAQPSEFLARIDAIYLSSPADTFDVLELTDGRVLERFSRIQFIGEENVGRVWSFRDITQRRATQEALQGLLAAERAARTATERASRMKDEFLATLSHELRTPLNAILGWAQLLRTGSLSGDDQEQGLETIERNARLQAKIIEDLLDMSRIISGKIRLDMQRLDLLPVIEDSLDTVRPAAEAKGVRLQSVLDPLTGAVSGDPSRLQQVLWNLLSNAIKFTGKGGRVQVVLEQVNSHIALRVSDTGIGVEPEFLPYVFDRFRQADSSSTRQHGGLGLGLAIAKQLVEMHGGTIHVESAGEGQGTTFTIALPVIAVQASSASDPSYPHYDEPPLGAEASPNLAGVRVVVVDDEPDARELVRRILTECHAEVISVGTAAEALQQVQEFHPHVLVSDIGMPEEDGYALIRNIRRLSIDQGRSTPAIALTAYARSEDRRRAILSGFQMHIAKPVEASELVAMVASLAGLSSQRG